MAMATKDQHRAFIQMVQEEASSFGMNPPELKLSRRRNGEIFCSELFVHFDSDHRLAVEYYPMTMRANWEIFPTAWERVKAKMADAILKS